ncbi:ABC transporter permease [Brevundimonas lutea]|uniref:ABC transporter permease n=1 Tax=Brevundimonas lutea TaxID=2293980 RepID=UPI000F0255DB|nr:ABC transporter permease [Brevundimonas lutea]
MIALFLAHARGFVRDLPGLVMTLALPALVYLMFSAIFGAGSRGELDLTLAIHDGAQTPASRALADGLVEGAARAELLAGAADAERAVESGRADVGVLIAPGSPLPSIQVLSASGRTVAAQAVRAELDAALSPAEATPSAVTVRAVGPEGDMQAVYYAGAVSVMFVFFAAMHGAMGALDDRRSGLTARLSLAAGSLPPVLGARFAWMTTVGAAQSLVVFAIAWRALPPLEPLSIAAGLLTLILVAAAGSGLALAVVLWCRARDQAQPLSTVVVLLLAALGGSMVPRFLMPELFRDLGWLTPHAWAIEAYQAVLWRGEIDGVVQGAWLVLAGTAAAGFMIALAAERRRRLG